ncbi:RHS repeat domain-containing protein, partial [Fastidiosibacter lacustris]|uniref:RHS repeat domain-containing protein n=1 Tax=Fastidiosibacter lacustris TaxID=2056695 RepID=UPI001300287F
VIETRIKDARGNLVYQLKHSDTVASAAQGKEQDDANEYPKHKVVLNYDEAERITSIRSVYAENKTRNPSDDSVIPQQETQTHYSYNAWDEITRITTAGKGMTSFSYNEAGQLVKQKDNMGQEYGYGYDVLNRLTKVSINHKPILLYVYDQGQYGKGYLSEVTRLPSATKGTANTIRNSYDAFGNIGTQTNIINEKEYRVSYTYNKDNQINTITYPSGLTVYYAHNTLGKVDKLSINKPPFIVAKDIEHLPFGPITTLTYGNGYIQENGYDLRYRLTERNLKNIAHDHYRYDENGNISEIIHVSAPEWNTRYRYDRLDRLTAVESPKHRQIFTYKRAGEIDVDIKDLQHDLNGNLTWLNGLSLSYDEFNLLTEVRNQDKTVASYQYNGQGQRVLKTVDGKETVFIYDQFLNVIEIISEGETTDIIYLEGQPLAQMTQGQIDYFINDVQGTPERLIDQQGNTRWQADIQPFEIQETIKEIRQNLRFPGQYYDEETGFYYNGSRHYSPQLRSYIQPDPLDPLSGGSIDAYAYAENNPVNIVDPLGLCPSCHYNINCREYQADPLGALARHFGWQFLSYCYGTVTAFGGGFVNEISFGL